MRGVWGNRGDVFFTHSQSVLGRLIRWAETDPNEPNGVWANHAGVVVESGWVVPPTDTKPQRLAVVVEALSRAMRQEWWTAHGKEEGNQVRVFRLRKPLTEQQLQVFVTEANSYVGARYGWWKLLFHLADRAVFGGRKVLSSLMFVKSRPICSFLAAHAYEQVGVSFGMDPDAADPDEMMDYCLANPDKWEEA